MKLHILSGLVIAGIFATSAAQAATSPLFVDEIYSGMSATAIQKDQQANPAAELHSTGGKSTCSWHEGKNGDNLLYAAYPGDEYVEKAYLNPANQGLAC